ncbi:MAG: FkbM family methyltransferase [Bacteroidota bacterium]
MARGAISRSPRPPLPSERAAPSSSSISGAPGESGLRQRAFSNPDRARIQRITVPVGRLDDQTFEGPIHYVKIDVEGAEIGVLRGGRDFLARHRPIVSVEYGRPCRLRSRRRYAL